MTRMKPKRTRSAKITHQPHSQQHRPPWRTAPCNTMQPQRRPGKNTDGHWREPQKRSRHRNECWSHITTPANYTAGHPFTFRKERMSQLIAGTIWVLKVANQSTDRLQDISNIIITISSPRLTCIPRIYDIYNKHYIYVIFVLHLPPPPHNHFTALFSRPHRWASASRELLDFMVQGKINRGRADTPTIRLGATPSGPTSAHLHHPICFCT